MLTSGGVLADIEKALRENAEPSLARRVAALMESSAPAYNACYDDFECTECWPSLHGEDDEARYAPREDWSNFTIFCEMRARSLGEYKFGAQKRRYSYDRIEGKMQDWRGTYFYRGDRLLLPVAGADGLVTMAEVIYEDVTYEDPDELEPSVKEIKVKVVRDSRNVLTKDTVATLDAKDMHAATAVTP